MQMVLRLTGTVDIDVGSEIEIVQVAIDLPEIYRLGRNTKYIGGSSLCKG